MTCRNLLAVGLFSFVFSTSQASAFDTPMSFSATLERANLAFAGTVQSIKTRSTDGFIVRDIEFDDLVLARGRNPGRRLVLSVQGGTFGDREVVSADFPEFYVGRRYIVLSYGKGSPADWYLPVVGFQNGLFEVKTSETTGNRGVHDHRGREIVAIRAKHLTLLAKGRPSPGTPRDIRRIPAPDGSLAYDLLPPDSDPGTRVTEAQFLAEIRARSKEE